MVARRLADEAVQPAEFAFNSANAEWAERRIALYPAGRQQSAVIPLLMRAQEQEGWVSRAAIERVASMLAMPYIRVLEVATFYTQFQLQPVGRNAHIQVCGTTPCMLRGAEALRAVCESRIHPEPHHLNADGTLSWEEVECLGACVNAPMVAIGADTYEDLTVERFTEIVEAFAEGRGDAIAPGPQIERHNSAAEGGRTTLLEEPRATRERWVPPAPPEDPEPTTAGQPHDVTPESAPAIKGPSPDAKVSMEKAEAERKQADKEAGANGEPARAMREDAVGAESDAAKIDEGRAPGKRTAGEPANGAASTDIARSRRRTTPKEGPPEVNPVAEKGGSNATLVTAPEGEPDDLKAISGIGPALEARLNAAGITRYEQIAALGEADLARLDETLKIRARIERDGWIGQARSLAEARDARDGEAR